MRENEGRTWRPFRRTKAPEPNPGAATQQPGTDIAVPPAAPITPGETTPTIVASVSDTPDKTRRFPTTNPLAHTKPSPLDQQTTPTTADSVTHEIAPTDDEVVPLTRREKWRARLQARWDKRQEERERETTGAPSFLDTLAAGWERRRTKQPDPLLDQEVTTSKGADLVANTALLGVGSVVATHPETVEKVLHALSLPGLTLSQKAAVLGAGTIATTIGSEIAARRERNRYVPLQEVKPSDPRPTPEYFGLESGPVRIQNPDVKEWDRNNPTREILTLPEQIELASRFKVVSNEEKDILEGRLPHIWPMGAGIAATVTGAIEIWLQTKGHVLPHGAALKGIPIGTVSALAGLVFGKEWGQGTFGAMLGLHKKDTQKIAGNIFKNTAFTSAAVVAADVLAWKYGFPLADFMPVATATGGVALLTRGRDTKRYTTNVKKVKRTLEKDRTKREKLFNSRSALLKELQSAIPGSPQANKITHELRLLDTRGAPTGFEQPVLTTITEEIDGAKIRKTVVNPKWEEYVNQLLKSKQQ